MSCYYAMWKLLPLPVLSQSSWHLQHNLIDLAYECSCHWICENVLYAYACCVYLSFSMIRLTMCHVDNLTNHAFKGYSILLCSMMTNFLTPLMCIAYFGRVATYGSYCNCFLLTAVFAHRSHLNKYSLALGNDITMG